MIDEHLETRIEHGGVALVFVREAPVEDIANELGQLGELK